MAKYVVNKETTATTVKKSVRNDVMNFIIDSLKGQYGDEAVFWIRTGVTSPKTELCVKAGEAEVDGNTVPVYVTVGVAAKSFVESVGPKKTTPAFDVNAAVKAYEDHMDAMAEKEAARIAKKKSKTED